MNKPPRVVHPILLAIFPVVFLYSHNIGEVFLSQTMAPIAVCLAVGILLWCIIFAILRNTLKSAIITSLMLIHFFGYGHVFSLVKGCYLGSLKFGIHTYILPIWTLGIALPIVLVFRTKRDLCNLTKILNVITVCLVAISLSNIVIFHFQSLAHTRDIKHSKKTGDNQDANFGKIENKPDIYYIILDEHARADILKKEFGYDSSPFISHLRDTGFFVSENSTSNYMQTLLSIPSSTNFKYLDHIIETYGSKSTDKRPMWEMLVNNRMFDFLKEIGYSTVSFSTGCDFTELNNADHYLSGVFTANGFVNELLNSTPLVSLEKFSFSIHSAHYKRLNYTFDKLAETAKMPSPHIVFAHILCPHTPYVFNENGGFTGRSGPFRLNESYIESSEQKAKYIAQLKYVDKRITEAVDGILANSKEKPIIIIQADHGIRWNFKRSAGTSRNDCRFAILNALYLPGFDYSRLDNNITPVNTFRFIFNHYFKTEFEILENKNFRSGLPHFYDFEDVTDTLKNN